MCGNKFRRGLSSHVKYDVHNFITEKYRILFKAFRPTKRNFLIFTGSDYSLIQIVHLVNNMLQLYYEPS